jgi:calcium-dependent protein kinase
MGSSLQSLVNVGVVESRAGRIPFTARYHAEPRKLEDDYDVSKKAIGSGANGEVQLATSRQHPEQKFAVKTFNIGSASRSDLELVSREVGNYLCLDNPHIAKLFDVYESKDKLHLVMEYLEGGELFDRVSNKAKQRFSEDEARDALRQVLLGLNYLHSQGFVHRDVKLENCVHDKKDGRHIKLIDFGFSKKWSPDDGYMTESLGSLAYVAPEVLKCSYTSQCDTWSVGVMAFIMLLGYMPFAGSEKNQKAQIRAGSFRIKHEVWESISTEARGFIQALLEVDPHKRLSAAQALSHPWLEDKASGQPKDFTEVAEALRQFANLSKLKQNYRRVLARCLSNEEESLVRDSFIHLNADQKGVITLADFGRVMKEKLEVPTDDILSMFRALDYNNDHTIHYSDFLAAMIGTQIHLHDDLVRSAFRRLDTELSGSLTVDGLSRIIGSPMTQNDVQPKAARIKYDEFAASLTSTDLKVDMNDYPKHRLTDLLKAVRVFQLALNS